MPGFVLLVRARDDGDPAVGIGITVSGKVGNAVIRNRMKRRFRELARAVLPAHGIAGADHILIGRQGGIEREYGVLRGELEQALDRIRHKPARPGRIEPKATDGQRLTPSSRDRKKSRPSTGSGKTGTESEVFAG